MRAVIALPIQDVKSSKLPTHPGWPEPWVQSGVGLVKQVGNFGNRRYARATVLTMALDDQESQINESLAIQTAVLMKYSRSIQLIVLVVESNSFSAIDTLRRPGSKNTQRILESVLGVKLAETGIVAGTAAVLGLELTSGLDALLTVGGTTSSFQFDIQYSILISAVHVERMLISEANRVVRGRVSKPFSGSRTYGSLNSWMEISYSDSVRLQDHLQVIRQKLSLDQQKASLQRALLARVRAIEFAAAGFVAATGMASTYLSFVAPALGTESGALGPLLPIAFGAIAAAITWASVRR